MIFFKNLIFSLMRLGICLKTKYFIEENIVFHLNLFDFFNKYIQEKLDVVSVSILTNFYKSNAITPQSSLPCRKV